MVMHCNIPSYSAEAAAEAAATTSKQARRHTYVLRFFLRASQARPYTIHKTNERTNDTNMNTIQHSYRFRI